MPRKPLTFLCPHKLCPGVSAASFCWHSWHAPSVFSPLTLTFSGRGTTTLAQGNQLSVIKTDTDSPRRRAAPILLDLICCDRIQSKPDSMRRFRRAARARRPPGAGKGRAVKIDTGESKAAAFLLVLFQQAACSCFNLVN